jgi:hypothetical protein
MPKPKASYPWDYFDEISLTRVKCRICFVEFNKKTSNQQNHLKRHHKILRPGTVAGCGGGGADKTLSLSSSVSLNGSSVLANATNNINHNTSLPSSHHSAMNATNTNFVYNLLYEIQKKSNSMHSQFTDGVGSNGMIENCHGGSSEDMFDEDEEDGDIDDVVVADTGEESQFYGLNETNTSTENSASAYTEENINTAHNNDLLSSSNEQNIVTTNYRANEITSNDMDVSFYLLLCFFLIWWFLSLSIWLDLKKSFSSRR